MFKLVNTIQTCTVVYGTLLTRRLVPVPSHAQPTPGLSSVKFQVYTSLSDSRNCVAILLFPVRSSKLLETNLVSSLMFNLLRGKYLTFVYALNYSMLFTGSAFSLIFRQLRTEYRSRAAPHMPRPAFDSEVAKSNGF